MAHKSTSAKTSKNTSRNTSQSESDIPGDGRQRVVIEGVRPELDAGRYAIKRVAGESVVVEADIFTDGHDAISAVLHYRNEKEDEWHEVLFEPLVNDRWQAEFTVIEIGRYFYTIQAMG